MSLSNTATSMFLIILWNWLLLRGLLIDLALLLIDVGFEALLQVLRHFCGLWCLVSTVHWLGLHLDQQGLREFTFDTCWSCVGYFEMEGASIFLKSLWSNNATAVVLGHLELSFTSCGRSNGNKWCRLFVSFIPVHLKVNCVTDWLPCESNMTRCSFTYIKCSYWMECLSLFSWSGLGLCL